MAARQRAARIGAWLYGQTQLRIHRLVCNAFLRSLGRRLTPTEAAPRGPEHPFRRGPLREGCGVRILVTGATGFVGGLLTRRLLDDGYEVRCLVRDPGSEPARALEAAGAELAAGDLTRPAGLAGALDGVRAAYFLVHDRRRR